MTEHPVFVEVSKERDRQDRLWGEQNHDPVYWLSILGEEFGEACQAFNNYWFESTSDNLDAYREEIIQVAAVAVEMIECLDRNSNAEE